MRTLAIFSHTRHYKTKDGAIVGFGSTVTEINHLLDVFDQIIHVGMFYDCVPPESSVPYNSNRITFMPIPAVGGKTIKNKISIIWRMPSIIGVVNSVLSKVDYFQFRAPTGIGVIVVPYLILCSSKKGWFKYAGSWETKNIPLSYHFQQWMLKTQKRRKVTINGVWENQPNHCLSFINPCLSHKEIEDGQNIRKGKILQAKNIEVCFVGRLEAQKGLDLLIIAILNLPKPKIDEISRVHIVGIGNKTAYQEMTSKYSEKFKFYGTLSREKVQDIYKRSHAIILPSKSEGFPKVISEAMNYGCIPIVSNLSSISQFIIDGESGFIIQKPTEFYLQEKVLEFLNLDKGSFSRILENNGKGIYKFSYSHYNKALIKNVLE